MPAPSAIQIRYGTAGIAPLAAAAGQASFARSEDIRREASNRDLVTALAVRARRPLAAAAPAPHQPSPFELQKAADYHARTEAIAQGRISSAGARARTPLQIERDEEALRGQKLRNDALEHKGGPEQIESNVRQIEAMPGLSDETRAGLVEAVRNGFSPQAAMSQGRFADPRATIQHDPVLVQKAKMELSTVQQILARNDAEEIRNYARAAGLPTRNRAALMQRHAQLTDALIAVSGPTGPKSAPAAPAAPATGQGQRPDMPFVIAGDHDYANVPSNAFFKGPDGIVRVKP